VLQGTQKHHLRFLIFFKISSRRTGEKSEEERRKKGKRGEEEEEGDAGQILVDQNLWPVSVLSWDEG